MVPSRRVTRVFAILATLGMMTATLADAPPVQPPLELVVLGSGGPAATGRAASSYLVLINGSPRILVDAGPGAFARLGEAKLSLSATDIVLLTHLHIDHAGELPGLFKSRAVSGGRTLVFKVWGPGGSSQHSPGAYFPSTRGFLNLLFGTQGAFAYVSDFAAPITLEAHDLPAGPGNHIPARVIYQDGDLAIRAIAGHHGDAPAVIYRVDYAGKSITFSGDIDEQGLAGLRSIARGSDLLVFNTVVLDPPGSPAVLYTLHTPPHAIGEVAKTTGVHALLLSHLSPAVEGRHDEVLASIRQNYSGSVSFAEDLLRVAP